MKNIFLFFPRPVQTCLGLFLAFIFQSILLSAQICSSPSTVIYALNGGGNVTPVDVSTAAIGSTINPAYGGSPNSNALGYNNLNGKFYFFQDCFSGTQVFVSFDPATSLYATLANAPISNSVYKGCVTSDGTGYYCLDGQSTLCYYNIASNTWVSVCSHFTDQFANDVTAIFNTQNSGDLAFDGNGNLWIVSSNTANWGVYKISAPLPVSSTANINLTEVIPPTRTTPASTNFAGIAFSTAGEIYMSTNNSLYILKTTSALNFIGNFSMGGVGSDLTSCSFPLSVLPVVWKEFNVALQRDQSVLISWQVSGQTDNTGYYIERSVNGKDWDVLEFQLGRNGSLANEQYLFSDKSPNNGKNYYRIRQTDAYGTYHYSALKTIIVDKNNEKISIWPNPLEKMINILNAKLPGYSSFELYNPAGQKVSSGKLHSGTNSIDIGSLPAGLYQLHLKNAYDRVGYNCKLVKK